VRAEKIKSLQETTLLSGNQLGELIDASGMSVSRWLRGEDKPSAEHAARLEELWDCLMDLAGDDERRPEVYLQLVEPSKRLKVWRGVLGAFRAGREAQA
jgi:transcriptional regulator with XRE-family HTH domain